MNLPNIKCIACRKAALEIKRVMDKGITFTCTECNTSFFKQMKPDTIADIRAYRKANPPKKKKKAVKKKATKKKPAKKKNANKNRPSRSNKEAIKKKATEAAVTVLPPYDIEWPPQITDKEKKFCAEYIIDCNGNRAALAAGYAKSNANHAAYNIRCRPHVRKVLQQMFEQDLQYARITKQEIIETLRTITMVSPADFQTVGADGSWTMDIGPEHPFKLAIKKIKSTTKVDLEGNFLGVTHELELESKIQAAKLLTEVLGYKDIEGTSKTANISVFTNIPDPDMPAKK